MVSRRDQFQAYRFLTRRYAAALLSDDSDSVEGPMRRISGSVTASVMVALLVLAAVGLFGLLRPGGATSWKDGKSLIVERETATRYVYLGGVLHPVLNYASARLILHGGTVVEVSHDSLGTTPRGLPVGIPGAPDYLPGPSAVDSGDGRPWTVCSAPATDQTGLAHPVVRVTPGTAPGATAVGATQGILVRGANRDLYLTWSGQLLRIPPGYVTSALGYTAVAPLPVGDAWVNALPRGPDLSSLSQSLPGLGSAGPSLAGLPTAVGQVFQTDQGAAYVMYADGLAPITALQMRLLLGDPAIQHAYPNGQVRALSVTEQQVVQHRSAQNPVSASKLPAQPPTLVDTATTAVKVCATLTKTDEAPAIATVPAVTQSVTGSAAPAADVLGNPIADGFDLVPGHGALVREQSAPGVTTGTTYLIVEPGVKFPLEGDKVLADLGLNGLVAQPFTSGMLRLFPSGPALSEQAAAGTIPLTPANTSPSPSPAASR